jgi:hypothetical protein
MADREDNVYRAKLAEQAERYEGKCDARCWSRALYIRDVAVLFISLCILSNNGHQNYGSPVFQAEHIHIRQYYSD